MFLFALRLLLLLLMPVCLCALKEQRLPRNRQQFFPWCHLCRNKPLNQRLLRRALMWRLMQRRLWPRSKLFLLIQRVWVLQAGWGQTIG